VRRVLLIFLAAQCFCAASLFAIDGFFAGIDAETAANTRKGAALGGGLQLGVDMNEKFAAGINLSLTSDFDIITTVETSVFFRYYPALPFHISGIFAQIQAGIVTFFEGDKTLSTFLGGLAAGWQFEFGEDFYVEPFLRAGYPFIWGAGVTLGIRFGG
jgi:hypothetical protein